MNKLQAFWSHVPSLIRRIIVGVVGIIFIIASVLTGWLPGPGGIPLFLIGIAILATEFEWAQHVRDRILVWLENFGIWFRRHKRYGLNIIVLAVCTVVSGLVLYLNR